MSRNRSYSIVFSLMSIAWAAVTAIAGFQGEWIVYGFGAPASVWCWWFGRRLLSA